MKTVKTISTILILSFLGFVSIAQNIKSNDYIALKVKVYLESGHTYSDMADDLTVRVDELIDKRIIEYTQKSGRFSIRLDLNKHYIIYFSQDGFETRTLVFSTVGVNPANKYIFHADVMLKRVGENELNKNYPVTTVRYDYLNNNVFIIRDEDDRILHNTRYK